MYVTISIGFPAVGYESVTVSSSAVSLTTGVSLASTVKLLKAFITCENAEIRWRVDGTAPTSIEGHLLESGQNLTLDSPEAIAKFRAIRTGTSDATLRVSYFKG